MNKSITEMRDAIAKWNAALAVITPQVAEAIAGFRESWEVIREYILQCSVILRRFQLLLRLQRWMPSTLAGLLAKHWPERWLPRLDVGFMLRATRDEKETE